MPGNKTWAEVAGKLKLSEKVRTERYEKRRKAIAATINIDWRDKESKIYAIKVWDAMRHDSGGRKGIRTAALSLGLRPPQLRLWIGQYEKFGADGLAPRAEHLRLKPHTRGPLRRPPKEITDPAGVPIARPDVVAMIRYGMTELTDAQIGAYFGRSASAIRKVRDGRMGGPVVAPPTPPEIRSKLELTNWFIHKSLGLLEVYVREMERLSTVPGAMVSIGDLERIKDEQESHIHDGRAGHRGGRRRATLSGVGRLADGEAAPAAHGAGDRAGGVGEQRDEAVRPDRNLGDNQAPGAWSHGIQRVPGGAQGKGAGPDTPAQGWLIERRRR